MMKLGAFFHLMGNHIAAWLHPDAQIDASTNYRAARPVLPHIRIVQRAGDSFNR
jgi:hypothetical protein